MSEETRVKGRVTPRGGGTQTYPLNSRRINAAYLHEIAAELGLPTSAALDEIRQMIEGKLLEESRDPMNVQVVVGGEGGGAKQLRLRDESGTFLEVSLSDDAESGVKEEEADGEDPIGDVSGEVEREKIDTDIVRNLREALEETQEQKQKLAVQLEEKESELISLREELEREKKKTKDIWRMNCEQIATYDAECTMKDAELARLKEELSTLRVAREDFSRLALPVVRRDGPTTSASTIVPVPILPGSSPAPTPHAPKSTSGVCTVASSAATTRRGKAPPIDPYTAEDSEVRLEDWLPTLDRAATWNGWSDEEKLMQLAGHLRGRAVQEWNLISPEEKATFTAAVDALRMRLDPGNRVLATQDFRHACQNESESVIDYVRRLERLFQVAYGRDGLNTETREALLYSQLHEGLKYELMKSPAVSGAQSFKQLCLCAKTEEKRLAGLKRRQSYQRDGQPKRVPGKERHGRYSPASKSESPAPGQKFGHGSRERRCYICDNPGHLARDCTQAKKESTAKLDSVGRKSTTGARTKMVKARWNPQDLLYSSESEGEVHQVRVEDEGSHPRKAAVDVQGVAALGVVDSGADITIMNGELFETVAAAAHLRKKAFRKPDKVPYTYDQKTFKLDGCIDLDISFDGHMMRTPVYLKMDARDPLLLSEGVCRQLGIITYHPLVYAGREKTKEQENSPGVPMVRVKLVQTVRVLPGQSVMAPVIVEGGGGCVLVEPAENLTEYDQINVANSLVSVSEGNTAQVLLTNPSGFTRKLDKGLWIGVATEVEVLESVSSDGCHTNDDDLEPEARVCEVTSQPSVERKTKLAEMFAEVGPTLPWQERAKLHSVLLDNHQVFSVEEGERGETDLTQMCIDTGEHPPRKQAARRVPFAARREIAEQLRRMQEQGVIKPSASPWASPVVLVRKKDGTLRFCIDYRQLNAVTQTDSHPLPRIDDLLDQMGKSKYFTTLDLASGYWQVKVHPESQEKTAFVTHQGLYEFNVMPFGLKNAPAVFQRLMQLVLRGLNPDDGPAFVSVYIDDVLIFSETLEDHVAHLKQVLGRLREANLKLKPEKCHFICQQVEYLGHILTPEGLKPNPAQVSAVRDFPVPNTVSEVRQFMGLASYYRRFVKGFAKIAQPLHALTCKGAIFQWTSECQEAFSELKQRLIESPVLAYPDFTRGFILETDACVKGLGAILSQKHDDGLTHPVAYASRALSQAEKHYGITELETLAVVWGVTHFRAYLYGHDVVVYTDHSAVRAVLETPNPSGKHARWWSRVFGCGTKSLHIVYRAGRENANADALSRNPCGPAPEDPSVEEVSVGNVHSHLEASELLAIRPSNCLSTTDFAVEQCRDGELREIVNFLQDGTLPTDSKLARKLAAQAESFTLIEGILYFIDSRRGDRKRCAVPKHLRQKVMDDSHRGPMSGHFSGPKLYQALMRHWWWPGMYSDVISHCTACPQCAIVNSSGRVNRPPLHPIPVSRPFQILGVDIMDLPKTESGNRHVIVFQDFLTKFPLVFATPDQKAIRIARLLAEEVVPLFGVPECLLSDRGTNLLSHLMKDLCEMLGIRKLNTTAYHPQCDGMVERFNRTLKTMLQKHASRFGNQWDKYLAGVLWAYRNTPHDSTKEKPSYLLYGIDLRTPTEAAFLPSTPQQLTDVTDYREELTLSLASARELAAASIRKAQQRYKSGYDKKVTKGLKFQVGDWVLVHFPAEETGKARKLARPWHGPYRVVSVVDPDVSVAKIHFPQDGAIHVHQSRVKFCPPGFPGGFYWYGGKRSKPGRPPKWVATALEKISMEMDTMSDGPEELPESADSVPATSELLEEMQEQDDSSSAVLDVLEEGLVEQAETSRSESQTAGEPEGIIPRGATGGLAVSSKPGVGPHTHGAQPPACKYPLRSRSRRT